MESKGMPVTDREKATQTTREFLMTALADATSARETARDAQPPDHSQPSAFLAHEADREAIDLAIADLTTLVARWTHRWHDEANAANEREVEAQLGQESPWSGEYD